MNSTLDGVTTAIALFIFACLLVPNFIKNRTQYYVAFASLLAIILTNTLAMMFQSAHFYVFAAVVIGFLQFLAVTMLVLCAGGMSAKTLAGDLSRAYEVIRRGEEEKEVIIPLTGSQPKRKTTGPVPLDDDDEDEGREVFNINSPPTPSPAAPANPPSPPTPPADKSIPLED
jgi:hypothetical protein